MKKTGHGFIYTCIWLLMVANIGTIAGGIYYYNHQPQAPYYAVFRVGSQMKLQRMVAIAAPLYNVQVLRAWAINAATSAFTYDAANYETQFALTAQLYFTDDGAESFSNALKSSGAIDQLLAKKLIVSAVAYRVPVILAQGRLAGLRTWKIQVPLLVTYQSASDRVTHRYIITMLIVQQPTWRFPNGYGIQQFTVANAL
jgi:intracellular multiplication protein IcmL